MNPRLTFMLDIIQKMGDFQRKHFRTEIEYETKTGAMDVVSFVDKECEQIFREAVTQEFPGDAIMGEESYDPSIDYRQYERLWIIDPLDGTLMYKRGIPNYGVMIAYIENGKVQYSAIYLPETNELYHADKNGSYRNGVGVSVSSTFSLGNALTSIANWSLIILTQDDIKIAHLIRSLKFTVEFYSCASHFSLCAQGAIDGGLFLPTTGNIWDTVPGGFLIQQAGGKVTNFGSNSWDIFNPNVIFSNGHIHAEFQKLLES